MASKNKYLAGVAFFLLISFLFYQQFWVAGVLVEKGIEQELKPSPLAGLEQVKVPELTESNMFGVFDKQSAADASQPGIEQLFDIADKEYVGQIANFQFILYATAEYGGALSAKILVKDLDQKSVNLTTVKLNDAIANATLTGIKLTNVKLTGTDENNESQTIDLKLFSRIEVPVPN